MPEIGEQIELRFVTAAVPAQRFQNGLRRQSLVNEQRQRRHVKRQPLGLPRPIQKRPAKRDHPPNFVLGFGQALHSLAELVTGQLSLVSGGKLLLQFLQMTQDQ